MPKLIGLSQQHKKHLEILPFNDMIPCPALLYNQAKRFFQAFKLIFGNGSKTVPSYDKKFNTFSERIIGNFEDLSVALVNYHFSIEILLKALIFLKKSCFEDNLITHNLIFLLKEAQSLHPALSKIGNSRDYMLLLEELSNSFNIIRYAEGSVCCSHNKRSGWKKKSPLQELSELLDGIFIILYETFEEARKPP